MNLDHYAWLIIPLGLTRAMQLAMHDRIFHPLRELAKNNPVTRRFDKLREYVHYLVTCPWCVSMQLGLVMVALLAWNKSHRVMLWLLLAMAASLCAVVIDRIIDRVTPDPQPTTEARRPSPPPAVAQALKAMGRAANAGAARTKGD